MLEETKATEHSKPVNVILPSSEAYKQKIKELQYDFLKYFLGTFIIGMATAISTYIFKSYELKIQARKTESEYLKPYLDQYIKLREIDSLKYDRALDMAEFICRTATESELKTGWTDFRDYLKMKVDNLNNSLVKKNDSLIHISTATEKSIDSLRNRIAIIDDSIKIIPTEDRKALFAQKNQLNFSIDTNQKNVILVQNVRAALVEKANTFLAHPPIYATTMSASSWEMKGFDALFNKDVNTAIDAFNNAEQIQNGYHMVYEIGKYLRKNKEELKPNNSLGWEKAYATILKDYSNLMPVNVKGKLQDLHSKQNIK